MNNLLNFLIRHSAWFVFIILMTISAVLLVHNNPYQQSVYFTSANGAAATVSEGYSAITGYFHLKDINDNLQEQNARLEMELIQLRSTLNDYKMMAADTLLPSRSEVAGQYSYVVARVISNSISDKYNYITINRGSADGIKPDMGVIDQNGVVGIVNVVGRHSARVISLLNSNMSLSCKLRGSEYFGALTWDGDDPRYALLQELPKHGVYNVGDTIVTSGFSAVFPEGLMVGIVDKRLKIASDNFVSLRIKLSTNFAQLSSVRAIDNKLKPELRRLEAKDDKAETSPNAPGDKPADKAKGGEAK